MCSTSFGVTSAAHLGALAVRPYVLHEHRLARIIIFSSITSSRRFVVDAHPIFFPFAHGRVYTFLRRLLLIYGLHHRYRSRHCGRAFVTFRHVAGRLDFLLGLVTLVSCDGPPEFISYTCASRPPIFKFFAALWRIDEACLAPSLGLFRMRAASRWRAP